MKYLIVGLGNIGYEYENTRHNIGFRVLDALAKASNLVFTDGRYGATCELRIKGRTLVLLKPSTYMNLSGESIGELVSYYKVDEEQELLVIYDDVSLDVGQLRIRRKGSAGGHNGIKDIIRHLGTDVFPRIKIGVGEKPKGYDLADYVLGHFSREEREMMEEGYQKAAEAVEMILAGELDEAMNVFNRKAKPKEAIE